MLYVSLARAACARSETATVRIFQKGHLLAEIVCAPKPRLQNLVIPLASKLRA
jgi:hypothetical protein